MHLKPLTWKLADFVGKTADKAHTFYFDFLLYAVNNFVIPRAGKQPVVMERENSKGSETAQNKLQDQNAVATPQQLRSNPFEGRTTHIADDLWTYVSFLTFVADVVTDLLVCVKYYKERNIWWFLLTLSFTSVASIAVQLFSAKWLLEDSKRQPCLTYVLHVVHLGPVWR